MPALYYIDGYNVIHHSAFLRPLLEHNFEAARDALIEKVARYCVVTGNQAKIIFDGRGRRAEPLPPPPGSTGLEIVFSPGHQTADAYIERSVYNAGDKRNVIVVTSDRGIRNLCHGIGSLVMDPDNFLAGVDESDAGTRAALESLQRPDNLHRMEERLGGDMAEKLRQLKEKLDK